MESDCLLVPLFLVFEPSDVLVKLARSICLRVTKRYKLVVRVMKFGCDFLDALLKIGDFGLFLGNDGLRALTVLILSAIEASKLVFIVTAEFLESVALALREFKLRVGKPKALFEIGDFVLERINESLRLVLIRLLIIVRQGL